MILCEVDYQRAMKRLRRMGEDLTGVRHAATIYRLELRRDVLIREVCQWILTERKAPEEGPDFLDFLQSIQDKVGAGNPPLRRNPGNSTNHPGRRKVIPLT